MSLRVFSDQCVPAEITNTLRRRGDHVTLLREVLPTRSPAPMVIARAQESGAILLSLNGDFADIVSNPPSRCLSIVKQWKRPPTHWGAAALQFALKCGERFTSPPLATEKR